MNSSITYKTPDTTLPVFQLTEEDVVRSSTLDPEDVGKWCFLMNGCIMGFFDSREECADRVANLLAD